MKSEWKQLLLIAGGAAATGVALYYLLRVDGADHREGEPDPKKVTKEDATKEQVLMVLHDVLNTQEKIKGLMKKFTRKFCEEDCTFEEACSLVSMQHPDDPLHRYGLTMIDFDALLDKFQHDPEVKDAVLSIMGSATPSDPSPHVCEISKERLIEVHEFMRDELNRLANDVRREGVCPKVDTKVLTLAAQAHVGAKVQKKFCLTCEDIECSVLLHHKDLANNAAFARVNMAIQNIMNCLIESDGA